MKKNIKTNLFDSLIKSDFLIVNEKNIYIQNKLNVTSKKQIYNLNPVSLLKTLKQFIRLVQFTSKNIKGQLSFEFEDKHLKNLLEKFKEKYPTTLNLNSNGLSFNLVQNEQQKLLVLLGDVKYSNKKLIKKLLRDQQFLIQKINKNTTVTELQTYKIYNNLSEIKKFIFLLCLVRQITKN